MYKIIFFIFFGTANLFLLSACTQADNPKAVADKYWQNLQTGKNAEAEKLVSINSRSNFANHRDFVDNNTQVTNGHAKTVVITTITKFDANSNQYYTVDIETVLVLEQGNWKVDANQTQVPIAPITKQKELEQLADDLSESAQENIDSIDEAMNQGMEMLDKALKDGSQEMSQSLLHLMNELNSTMKESIEKMKKRRQQEEKEDIQQQKPDPRSGEGMI